MQRLHTILDWFGRWWKSIVIVAATAVAFFGAFWGNFAESSSRAAFFWTGVGGAVVAASLPILETRQLYQKIRALEAKVKVKQDQAVADVKAAKLEGRKDFLLVMDFALKPLLQKLGPMIRSRRAARRKELGGELKMLALSALKEVIGSSVPMTRANYFKIQPKDGNSEIYLTEAGSTASPPRNRFNLTDRSDQASMAILGMIEEDSYVFTEDIMRNPPPGFDNAIPRKYKTFISAAANDGVDADGMVTIDSPESGSLTEADATLVRLVGTIIALSESIRDAKLPPEPEP
ncbi:hypothetical protein [Arthrobacter ramosus]|uniref:hypothetical protein n=1 Tax=Arthrobacter ramosus TaxID=1672 RepID=UPI001F435A54|nr:hypothetical protein [Arthrobacter ramosus]